MYMRNSVEAYEDNCENRYGVEKSIVSVERKKADVSDNVKGVEEIENAFRYKKIVVGRKKVIVKYYEKLNVKKAKEVSEMEPEAKTKMADDEKERHYLWRQIKKGEVVRDMLEINFCPLQSTFVTLTFEKQPDSVQQGNCYFRNFVRLLKRKYSDLLFLAVLETAKDINLHYHVIFNVAYTKQFENEVIKGWKHGKEIDVQMVYDIDGLSWYMTKEFAMRSTLLYGRKRYLHSENLEQAANICNWNDDIDCFSIVDNQIRKAEKKHRYVTENDKCGKMKIEELAIDLSMYSDYVVAIHRT